MLVPKLRFKREDGTDYPEWRGTSFGETCSGFEYGMNTAACDYDGVNKYIRITDIDDTSRRYLSENAVSPKGNMQDKYIVNPNDILFARTGASVGKAYLYKDTDGLLYYAGFLIRANVNADANAYFVFSQTLTADYWNWVKLTSMRTGQQGINAQEYKGYKYNAPCLEEQQKIANFLSTVDEVIAQSEAEVQNLEQQKKAAMQKIFSQEVRFKRENGSDYPEWEEKVFTDLFKSIPNKDYQVQTKEYKPNGKYRIIDQSQSFIAGYSDLESKVCYQNPCIIFGDHTTILKYVDFPFIVGADGVKTLIANDCYVAKYCFYLLGFNNVKPTGYNRHYSKLKELTLLCSTDIEEQQKIADFLSAYDEAISYAKQELDKWKELKKGLLQQMFV